MGHRYSWRDTIKKAMRQKGVTQDDIALRLKTTRGSVGHKLAGRRETSLDELFDISEAVGLLPIEVINDYLAEVTSGRIQLGAPSPGEIRKDVWDNASSDSHVIVGNGSLDQMVFVPAVRGARLSAGGGEIIYDADEETNAVAFRIDWMQSKGLRPERCKVWRVRGDSMEPRYSAGDSLLIDLL